MGSAEDETYDQLLESVFVGPVNVGKYRFVLQVTITPFNLAISLDCYAGWIETYAETTFQADPPEPSKIREEDIIGVTVLLLTCSYAGQEFIRVGYYVNNDYDDEQLKEEPPQKVLLDRVQRNILADKPRVTKFPINFHPENNDNGQPTSPDHDNGEQTPASPDHAAEVNLQGEEPNASPNKCNVQCPQA